jgi:hydrogenase small subunit
MGGQKVSRRDFIKIMGLGSIFSMISLTMRTNAFSFGDIIDVKGSGSGDIEILRNSESPDAINVIWFEGQSCTGDSIALLDAVRPSVIDVITGTAEITGEVNLRYMDAIMPEWSSAALQILEDAISGKYDPYVLVLEGAFPIDEEAGGPRYSGMFGYSGETEKGPKTFLDWLRGLISRAVAVVSTGTCASYGGIPADSVKEVPAEYSDFIESFRRVGTSSSPTGATGFFGDPIRGYKGLIDILPSDITAPYKRFLEGAKLEPGEVRADIKPAIAVPGCPANGQAQIRALGVLILWARGVLPPPPLDRYYRPVWIYGRTTHEQCPRAASYAVGEFREYAGDPSWKCLFRVGCKGPVSNCPWNKEGWILGIGGPTKTGAPCIACTMPGFSDAYEPFFEQLRELQLGPPIPKLDIGRSTEAAVGIGTAMLAGAGLAYALKEKERR